MKFSAPALSAAVMAAFLFFGICLCPAAPVAVTGTMSYTQNFNSLGTTAVPWVDDATLPGWYAQVNSGSTSPGALQPNDGATALNGLLNLGSDGATDRALGSKATSTGNLANISYAVQFQNTSAAPVQVARLIYSGEIWRTNSEAGTSETWTVYSRVSTTPITNIISGVSSANPVAGTGFTWRGAAAVWTSPAGLPADSARDGNAAGNFSTVNLPLTGFILYPGEYLLIKWTDTNVNATDGHQALDNVTVQFNSLAGVAGMPDPQFQPAIDGGPILIQQPDGKVVIAGNFDRIGGELHEPMARFESNGTLDASFVPPALGDIESVAVLDDGKYAMIDTYTVRKLNTDGTLASPFSVPTIGDYIYGLVPQADGKFVIGGSFTTPRTYVARLNSNGSLDSNYNPNADGRVFCMTRAADGKILLGGQFTNVGGAARARLARLLTSGAADTSFNASIGGSNPSVHCIAFQADGKILIGGYFTSVSGSTRNRIARLNADGSLDASFNPNVDDRVGSMVVQCDGKILIAGDFTAVGGTPRAGCARLLASGALDTTFLADSNFNGFESLWCQADGKVLAGGFFDSINGVPRDGVARLLNNPAAQSIVVPAPDRVQWLRSGTAPEAVAVNFDLSTNGGQSWTPLGAGTRISGGWQLAGLALPASGHIRGRTLLWGAQHNSSSAPWEMVQAYAFPEIAVDLQPAGTALTDGGTVAFGTITSGPGPELTFRITNSGIGDLTGVSATIDGTDASAFTLTSAPSATVSPSGGTTTFTVRFAPATPGSKTAVLHIAGNDPDESPFDVTLTGTLVTALQAWRQANFGSTANAGDSANDADPDRDGRPNLIEYAFGSSPLAPSPEPLPAWILDDDILVLTFAAPAGVTGVSFIGEYSLTGLPGTWVAIPDSGTSPVRIFALSVTGPRIFARLRVLEN